MSPLAAIAFLALSVALGVGAGLLLVAFLDKMSDLVTRRRGN